MVQMAVSASAAATIVGVLLVIQLTAATRPISESTEATTLLRAPGRRSLLQTSAPAEAQGPLESIVTEPDGSPKAISAVISVVTTAPPSPPPAPPRASPGAFAASDSNGRSAIASAAAPAPGDVGRGVTLQASSLADLAVMVQDDSVSRIELADNITLSEDGWLSLVPTGTATVNRPLQLAAVVDAPHETVLDFGRLPFALLVGGNGDLSFNNVTIRGLPTMSAGVADVNATDDRYAYRVVALPFWPSVGALPGAQLTINSSTVYLRDNGGYANCTLFQARQAFQNQQIYGPQFVETPSNGVLLTGVHVVTLPIINSTAQKTSGTDDSENLAGSAELTTFNFTSLCELPNGGQFRGRAIRPEDQGPSFPWWAGFLIGVVIAALLLCGLCMCMLRRRNRKLSRDLKLSRSLNNAGSNELTGNGYPKLRSSDMTGSGPLLWPHGSGAISSQGSGGGEDCMGQHLAAHRALLAARAGSGLDGVEVGPMLGRGSYGRVYRGRWHGAMVAIKVIDATPFGEDDAVNSARESLLAASMSHPNVIATYKICSVRMGPGESGEITPSAATPKALDPEAIDATPRDTGDHEDAPQGLLETWMLLEYADRGSLEAAIKSRRFYAKGNDQHLDMVAVYKTLLDIATGMTYLHGLGIVHGDLKAANALLKSTVTDTRGFTCKLADFGLSRILDLNCTHVSTQSFGTVPYMPPELLSSGRLSLATDAFSFAILMWELFTGTEPYKGLAFGQVMFNVVHKGLRPDLPPDCPPAYLELMTACWADNEADRPTFDKIVAELSVQAREAAVTAKEQAAVAAAAAQAAATAAAAGAASNEHSRNPSVAGGGAYGGGAPADSPHGSARVLAHHGGRESAAGHSPGLSPLGGDAVPRGWRRRDQDVEALGDLSETEVESRAASVSSLRRMLNAFRRPSAKRNAHPEGVRPSAASVAAMRAGPDSSRIEGEWNPLGVTPRAASTSFVRPPALQPPPKLHRKSASATSSPHSLPSPHNPQRLASQLSGTSGRALHTHTSLPKISSGLMSPGSGDREGSDAGGSGDSALGFGYDGGAPAAQQL
eukprot:CAMPEP_0206147012 /NCGR_PEP_ID=MMETSP1473-20131121/32126_1 /ASSEMBLY_ACC=CAM_ASM_001109 /TAXON_ID=1461547 /ORGANISM="Stichococcus sp, Strain RCC1054" /LENGTH=1059 /DNA_ID=CAMNT_0053543779 /DNA_START=733 /DNA_END=3909 /DNA_ORIENTATION=+